MKRLHNLSCNQECISSSSPVYFTLFPLNNQCKEHLFFTVLSPLFTHYFPQFTMHFSIHMHSTHFFISPSIGTWFLYQFVTKELKRTSPTCQWQRLDYDWYVNHVDAADSIVSLHTFVGMHSTLTMTNIEPLLVRTKLQETNEDN